MRTILKLWLALAACLAFVPGLGIGEAGLAESVVTSPWQTDLTFLRTKLVAIHPEPFRKVGRGRFDSEADRLNQTLAGATREQAIVGMMRLVAMLGDGHTSVLPGPQIRAGFHVLPLRFYLYGDDLVIDGADRAYAEALGGRLDAINGVPAHEVIRRVREVTPGDNPSTVNGRIPSYLVVPEVLAGLGIIPSASGPVPITVHQGSNEHTIRVVPVPPSQDHAPPGITTVYSGDWVDRAPAVRPLWLRNAARPYWFAYLAKDRALYLQYNICTSDPAESMPAFARRLQQEIVKRQPQRVVVDLRLNSGGEGYWNRSLIRALLRSAAASEKGTFFVLIGRQTFSAGNMMAIELEKYASVTFIGEPSGGRVQGFGNHEPVFLPNSGLGVMIATKFYQNDGPNDDRPAIVPQVTALLTPEDYASGRDPALEAALRFKS